MKEDEKNSWKLIGNWDEELDRLHSIIGKTELVLTTKWGGPTYTYNGKNVLGLGGFKNYFTIWFWNGAFLKDERKLLVNAQEGVTKGLRQWRFTSKDEIDEPLLLAYILESIENENAGKAIQKVKKEFSTDPIFQKELDLNIELKAAFEQFTPFRQKEFLEYINTAKREETKRSRIEKVKPMILQNIGLNDKYR